MDQRRDIEKNGNVYVAKYQREDYTSLGKKPNSSRHLAIIIGGPNPQTVKEACQRELQALRSEDPMGFRLMRKVSPNAVIITQGDTDTQGFNDDQILEARGEVSSSQNELNRWMNQSVRTMTAPAGRQPTPSDQSKTNPSKPTGGQTKP